MQSINKYERKRVLSILLKEILSILLQNIKYNLCYNSYKLFPAQKSKKKGELVKYQLYHAAKFAC